jgi:hypothetical protein
MAMRIPTFWVRCAARYDVTPYTPGDGKQRRQSGKDRQQRHRKSDLSVAVGEALLDRRDAADVHQHWDRCAVLAITIGAVRVRIRKLTVDPGICECGK